MLLKHREEIPSYDLFGQLLDQAFRTDPAPFEDAWLNRTRPPDQGWLYSDSFKREMATRFGMTVRTEGRSRGEDFAFLQDTILFQIADLRRMHGAQTMDKMRYFGLDSPTGSTWYNWDPFAYLECGTRGFISHLELGHYQDFTEARCNWITLAVILELGQVYE